MSTLGRRVFLWMIPLHLLLIAWVWFGRLLFGVGGWFLLIYLISVVPVLLAGLLVTTVMAFVQPGRPRSLTRAQSLAQLATWLGMLLFGAFSVDFGDTEDSYGSLLTQVFGPSDLLLDVSWWVMIASALLTVAAWLVLLVALVAGRRSDPE